MWPPLSTPQGAKSQNNSNLANEGKSVLRASNGKIKQHIGFIITPDVRKYPEPLYKSKRGCKVIQSNNRLNPSVVFLHHPPTCGDSGFQFDYFQSHV